MPNENNKILKYNPGAKSLKAPFVIYEDLECLLEKIDTCQNNPEKSYTEKKAKHKPSGYSRVTCCLFDKSKTEWNYYRGKDCMEKLCKDLKDQTIKMINYEKKDMIRLINKEKKSYESKEFVIYAKKNIVLIICFRTKSSFNQTHFKRFVDNGNEKGRSKNE